MGALKEVNDTFFLHDAAKYFCIFGAQKYNHTSIKFEI